jgi:hypothetical protein
MASTEKLGNGVGYIYVVEADGTSVVQSLDNIPKNVRTVKGLATQSVNEARNKVAYGTVQVTATTTGQNVTAINVNGVNQISGNIATTATVAALATAIANGINSYTPGSGVDYTAEVNDDTVTLFATEAAGDTVNGHVVAAAASDAAITFTTANIDFGGDPDTLYDSVHGYRFFLYANSAATIGSISGATEITTELMPQGLQGAMVRQASTISSGVVTFTRTSMITRLKVDTESSASTDDLDTITAAGFNIGDILIVQGENSGRVTTVKDATGNVQLNGGDFDTATLDATLVLILERQTSSDPLEWFEVSRSPQAVPSVADFRGNDIAIVGTEGKDTITLTASGGTTTLTANTDEVYQVVSGSATLTSNATISLSTTGAVEGDRFIIQYDGTITVGSYTLIIGGITLSSNQALTGGWIVDSYYDGSAWNSRIHPNMNTGSNEPQVETDHIADESVTIEKVETGLHTDVIVFEVSFETSELGDHKIKWPYAGTVNEVYGAATKLIEATDDAVLCVKDNASATATTLTWTAGSAIGSAQTGTPTANNTFVAGDVWAFNTAKVTAGGKAMVSVKITKT